MIYSLLLCVLFSQLSRSTPKEENAISRRKVLTINHPTEPRARISINP